MGCGHAAEVHVSMDDSVRDVLFMSAVQVKRQIEGAGTIYDSYDVAPSGYVTGMFIVWLDLGFWQAGVSSPFSLEWSGKSPQHL
jgi:hypothetical protein